MRSESGSAIRGALGYTRNLLFFAALLVLVMGMIPAGPTRAEPIGTAGPVSVERAGDRGGAATLIAGEGALSSAGRPALPASERPPYLSPASCSAASGSCWSALAHHGLDDAVFDLAVLGADLYVAGNFTGSRDRALADLSHIARYDTTTATWHALSNGGLNRDARALALIGSNLYVGGLFTETVDGSLTDLGRIARYDTAAGTWHALPKQGLNGSVWALAAVGTDLYVGGYFTGTVDGSLINLGSIARYDTVAGTWEALPDEGLYGQVFVLEVAGSDLYVGGNFAWFGDMSALIGCVARYDTAANTWSTLPNQVGNGVNAVVYGLEVVGTDLFVGGYFTQSGDGLTDLGHVARYDTVAGTWHALPNQGLDASPEAIESIGSDLYVGGHFTQTLDGTIYLGHVARYDTTAGTWHALPNEGLNNWVLTFATVGDDLYLGGYFDASGDFDRHALGHIARYGICYPVFLPSVPNGVLLASSTAGEPRAVEQR